MKGILVMARIALVLSAVTAPGWSQEKKEPSQGHVAPLASPEDSSQLPKIDLPEFVITGKEVFSFKEFSKDDADISQPPMLGPSAVREGKQVTGRIGIPSSSGLSRPEGLNGSVAAGYGSFSTPYVDGWFGTSAASGSVLLRAGLKTSDGHVAHAGYRHGYSNLSSRWFQSDESSFLPGASIDGQVGVTGDSYRLYGSVMPDRERTVTQFSSHVGMAMTGTDGVLYHANLGWRSTSLRDSSVARGSHIAAAMNASGTIEGFDVRGSADFDWSFYEAPASTADPFLIHLGVSGGYLFAEGVEGVIGLSGYIFRGSDNSSEGALFPSLVVNWTIQNGIRVYGAYEPQIEKADLSTLIEQNPYLRTAAAIRHPDHAQKFTLGGTAELTPVIKSGIAFSYDRVMNSPLFVDTARAGIWDIEYLGRTTFLTVEGSLFADLGGGDQLGLTISLRSVRNSAVKAVPYVPLTELSATYMHRFPVGIALNAAITLAGPVWSDLDASRSLPGYASASLEGSCIVVRQLEGVVRIGNVFNSAHSLYEGYPGQGRSLSAGIRYNW